MKKVLFALLVILLSLPFYAQETGSEEKEKPSEKKEEQPVKEEAVKIPTVTVTAPVAPPTEIIDAPYKVFKATDDDFDSQPRGNFADILNEALGVMGQKTAWGMASPFIRGLTGYRTLLLIDGVRFNNSVLRSGPNEYWTTVDLYSVMSYELLSGPSSVLYGSDAMGGTVAVATYDPFDENVRKLFPKGRLVYRYASAEQSNTAHLRLFKVYKNFAITVGATGADYDDLICGKHIGLQPYTAYKTGYSDLRLDFLLSDKVRLTAATQYGEVVDVPRTHRTIYMKSWYRTTIGTNRVEEYNNYRSLSYIQLKAQKLSGFIDTAKLSLSFQNLHNYVVTLRSGSTVYNYNGFDVGTLGFFAIAATPKTSYGRFSFGMESYSDNIDSSRYTKNIATNVRTEYARGEVADDSKYILSGLFIQNEFSAAKWLDLTAGIRYTYASLDAGVVDPDPTDAFPYEPFKSSYDALVCSFRALLRLKEEKETASRIIFGVSQGFRAPNLDDTTTFRPVATASHDIPSPDVKPEYCTNFEIGYRELKKGENKSSLLELFYFYNNLQDFIERVPTTYAGSPTDPAGRQYYAKENFSSGYIHGVEFSLEWSHKLEKWMENTAGVGRFTFSWTEGYGDALVGGVKETRPLTRTPPITFKLRCGLKTTKTEKRDSFFIEFVRVLKQTHLSPADKTDTGRIPPGGTPGYYLLNLGFEASISKNSSASLFIENLTNRDWRIHGSGINGPGTNIVLVLEARF